MMSIIEARHTKLAEDFSAWASGITWAWKEPYGGAEVKRYNSQFPKLPVTPKPISSKASILTPVSATATPNSSDLAPVSVIPLPKAPVKAPVFALPAPIPIPAAVGLWLKDIPTPPASPTDASSLPVRSGSSPQPAALYSRAGLRFSEKYFDAKPSPKGGIGAFANQDILAGTIIISEEPLIRCLFQEVFMAYEELTIPQRKLYKSLYGWKGIESHPILAIFKTNR